MKQSNLPKNIRQIGQADKEPKIYIEDYVITFARKMAEKSERGLAVLMGKENKKDAKEPVFIKGAVQITDWEESERIVFDNEIWSNIYEGVKNFFPELEIVGWMLLHSGQEAGFEGKANAIHKNNFKENGNILFVFDKEEKEENFYRFEGMEFVKQPGYYIYYEKNEAMQNYMIELFGNKSQEPEKEDKVMEQVRELLASKEPYRDKQGNHFVYAASTALASVVLVMGAATLSNYDKMESMEATLNHISANMEDDREEEMLVVETITGTVEGHVETDSKGEDEGDNISQDEEEKENSQEKIDKNEISENDILESQTMETETLDNESSENEISGNEAELSEEENETEATMSEGSYYVVKKGDTLVTISGAIYGSDEYVDQLKELNQIENADMIYEGQKLILP